VRDTGADEGRIYADGSQSGSSASDDTTGTIATDDYRLLIGGRYQVDAIYNWDGLLDEVRISAVVRTPDDIKAEFENINDYETDFSGDDSPVDTGAAGLSIPIAMHHYKQIMGVN